jgi:hypothetical protein
MVTLRQMENGVMFRITKETLQASDPEQSNRLSDTTSGPGSSR